MSEICSVCNGTHTVLNKDWEEWNRIIDEKTEESRARGGPQFKEVGLEVAIKYMPDSEPLIPCTACTQNESGGTSTNDH